MSHSIQFDPDARREFLDAMDWYDQENPSLGLEFFNEVDSTLKKIFTNPDTFSPFLFSTRRCLLHRFPYSIVYRDVGSVIWVIAVAHTSRRPDYWKDRF